MEKGIGQCWPICPAFRTERSRRVSFQHKSVQSLLHELPYGGRCPGCARLHHHLRLPGLQHRSSGANIPGGDGQPRPLLPPRGTTAHVRASPRCRDETRGIPIAPRRFVYCLRFPAEPRLSAGMGAGGADSGGPRTSPSLVGNPATSTGRCEMPRGWKTPVLPQVLKRDRKSKLRDLPRASPALRERKAC